MRILNILFQNLNSLAGKWKIDLEQPEYQSEGAFLITGPTGAGKTTILDAICLALYGRTPRVTFSANQSEVMTRGARECCAEVEFETSAGRFRAVWSQKRTRAKSRNPFQQPERRLYQNDRAIAEKIRDVEEKIVELTGLDFNRFTRAVLLSQNGFDRFLKASEKDRSDILENLTDTSIYTRLSQFAHEKAKLARQNVERLEEKKRELQVPDAAEEANLRLQHSQIESDLAQTGNNLRLARENLAWLETLASLRAKATQIDEEGQKLEAERAAFQPREQELNAAMAVQPYDADFQKLAASAARDAEIAAKLDEHQNKATRLAQAAGELGKLAEAARLALDERAKAENDNLPRIAQARSLDAKLGQQAEQVANEKREVASRQKDAERARSEAERQERDLGAMQARFAKGEKWLADHGGDAWLIENFSALQGDMREAGRLDEHVERARKARVAATNRLAREKAELANGETAEKSALARLQAATEKLQQLRGQFEEMIAGKSLEDLRAERENVLRQRNDAMDCDKIQQYAHLLKDGEPCPLCGSREHPCQFDPHDVNELFARHEAISRQISDAEALERAIFIQDSALDKERAELRNIGEKLKERRQRIAELEQESETAQKDFEEAAGNADTRHAEIAARLAPFELGNTDYKEAQTQLGRRLETYKKARDEYDKIGRAVEELKSKAQSGSVTRDLADKSLRQAQEGLARATIAFENLQNERQALFGDKNVNAEEKRLRDAVQAAREHLDRQRENQNKNSNDLAQAKCLVEKYLEEKAEAARQLAEARAQFADILGRLCLTRGQFEQCRRDAAQIDMLKDEKAALERKASGLEARRETNARELELENAKELTAKTLPEIKAEKERLEEESNKKRQELGRIQHIMQENEQKRKEAQALETEIASARQESGKWEALNARIGSHDGSKFRNFAQNVTLDVLLDHANAQLGRIMDRYLFRRAESGNLGIEVVDNYQAGETRAIENLSGGETFIASLALALGLSSMAAKNGVMGSLFLDEGFGSLDSETLCDALDAIGNLRQEGKVIGIISHVEALKERVPTHINVRRSANPARSEISGPGCRRLG